MNIQTLYEPLGTMERFEFYLSHNKLQRQQHQIEGVQWCLRAEQEGYLCENQTIVRGGILADEMGLGKTIQMIGLMLANIHERTLLVLPLSLLKQWQDIIYRTTSKKGRNTRRIMLYHGPSVKSVTLEQLLEQRIVITTYGMIHLKANNKNLLHQVQWNRVVYDEGHHLRNNDTKVFDGAMALKTHMTWLMTGTPIQNKRSDIFNLLSVLRIPAGTFRGGDSKLHECLSAVMLRRTKDVLSQRLPDLRINTIPVTWSSREEAFATHLHSLLHFSRLKYSESSAERYNMSFATENRLALIIRARQMCILPSLVPAYSDNMANAADTKELDSSKIRAVVKMLIERIGNGHHKLVFCHFRGEMDKIKELLPRHVNVKSFDGRIPLTRRNQLLSEQCDILILQIQTGCEGLNLQQFSEVYFVSPHWNPEVESQAIARCHRIGQQKPVEVFRFETQGFIQQPADAQPLQKRKAIQEEEEEEEQDAQEQPARKRSKRIQEAKAKAKAEPQEQEEEDVPTELCVTLDQHSANVQKRKRDVIEDLIEYHTSS